MVMPIDLMDTTITVNVQLGGVPVSRAGFGTVMLLSPACNPAVGLVVTYQAATAVTALAADLSAGVIDATIKAAVECGFAQARRPTTIKVGKVPALNVVSTLDVDLAAIIAQDNDFYGVCLDNSAAGVPCAQNIIDANILKLAASIEALDKLFCAMDFDVLVYAAGGGVAAALKALSYEHTAFCWSQLYDAAAPGTAYQPFDMAAACRWLAWGPDDYSAPFRAPLTGVYRAVTTAAFTDLTAAQIAFAQGHHANLGLLFGSAATFLDEGINCNGREWIEVLAKHWLKARIKEDLADIVVDRAARGLKFPLSNEGIAICNSVASRRLQQGASVGHFSAYQLNSSALDSTTKTITIGAQANVLGNARLFTFNISFLS